MRCSVSPTPYLILRRGRGVEDGESRADYSGTRGHQGAGGFGLKLFGGFGHGTGAQAQAQRAAAGVAVGHSASSSARYHVAAGGAGINDDIKAAFRRAPMFRLSSLYDDWLLARYGAVQPGQMQDRAEENAQSRVSVRQGRITTPKWPPRAVSTVGITSWFLVPFQAGTQLRPQSIINGLCNKVLTRHQRRRSAVQHSIAHPGPISSDRSSTCRILLTSLHAIHDPTIALI